MTPLFRIRASAAGKIMTDPKNKGDKEAGRLGETAKSYVKEWDRAQRWGREKDLGTPAIEKGKACEEDAFDLIGQVQNILAYKNPIHLENEWATGTPDAYNKVTQKLISFDVKSSWDWTTLPYPTDGLDKIYEWQNLVYAWLAEAESWTTKYCLVNTPPRLVMRAKDRKWYDLGCPERTSDEYVQACMKIERDSIYDLSLFLATSHDAGDAFELHTPVMEWDFDVPKNERIVEFTTVLDMSRIEALKERVKQCREYLLNPY